jgi:hypothetical protein
MVCLLLRDSAALMDYPGGLPTGRALWSSDGHDEGDAPPDSFSVGHRLSAGGDTLEMPLIPSTDPDWNQNP